MATTTKRKTSSKKKTTKKVTAKMIADTLEKEVRKEEEKKGPGRPLASKNKLPLKVRELLVQFLGDVLPEMIARFPELDYEKQWETVGKVLPYVTPKMISNDVNASIEVESVNDQLSKLANESLEKFN